MKSMYKKSLAVAICFLFMLTIAQAGICKTVNSKNKEETEKKVYTQEITLYRYGLDGEINPVEVEIVAEEGEDLSKVVQEKCKELFKEDEELQGYVQDLETKANNSGFKFGWGSYRISSRGIGSHFKTKWIIRLVIKFILFKLGLPRLNLPGRRRVIYCNYNTDPKANTTVEPILGILGTRQRTSVEGNHSVFVNNFRGFTTWIGRFSKSSLIPRAFYGIGTFFTIS